MRPRSARARTSRSSAMRTRWLTSPEAPWRASWRSSRLRPSTSAESTSAFRIVSGVRSSWLASSTNRRSRSSAAWSRSKVTFRVTASRASVSSVWGTGSRRVGSDAEMASASRRIRSTGRRAAPASSQPISDDRRSATGKATANRMRAWSSASWLSLSVAPTTTNARCPAAVTGTIKSRDVIEARGGRSVHERGSSQAASSRAGTSAARATAGVVSTIRPEGVSTWANASSASIRRRRPPSDGIGVRGVSGDDLRARLQPGVDRGPQVGPQIQVDEHGDTGEHDGHPRGERQRESDPKRRVRRASSRSRYPTPLTVSSDAPPDRPPSLVRRRPT